MDNLSVVHSDPEIMGGTPEEWPTSRFRVGEPDKNGYQINHVFASTKEFVVYRSDAGVRVYIDDDHLPENDRMHSKRYLRLGSEISRVSAMISSVQPDIAMGNTLPLEKQHAAAIAQCLNGNPDIAIEVLSDVEQRVHRLKTLKGRLQYQISGAGVVAALLVVLLIVLVVVQFFPQPLLSEITGYAKVAFCGALGGFLSVCLGIRNLPIDFYADRTMNYVAGASRIVIAVVASLFVYFGMKSGLVLTALDSPYGIYAASVIAGFSESLVPNVIRSVSTDPPSVAPHSPRQELVLPETSGETLTRTTVRQDHGSSSA